MASVVIQAEDLRSLARAIFVATGSDADEATIVADHLVEANLCGHDSHGVGLIPTYIRDRRDGYLHANGHAQLVQEDGVIGIFDGGYAYGHVVAKEATGWGVAKARASGTAIVALRETYHLARVGSYGEQAAAAGLISIIFVNAVAGSQPVAPFGGTDGRLQTNPICISVPVEFDRRPVVLDFATSRIALGKVRLAYNEKRESATRYSAGLARHTDQRSGRPVRGALWVVASVWRPQGLRPRADVRTPCGSADRRFNQSST